ncbi:MAG: sigma-70 family RNA polymerase sigma factor [Hyphomicrobiales bacterium]|nr:sigma-70 family RNA polymerase sigma factor [Hyphomicrobiales bacterium]
MAPDINANSDDSLLALIARGSHAAFVVLVNRYAKRFHASAYYLLNSREDAEDVVQEAFLRLWRRPDMWDAGKGVKFATWFNRIVVNAALDTLRRRRRPMEALDVVAETPDDQPHPDEWIEANKRKALVDEAIKNLPEHQQLALNLCFYAGMSNQEAADAMGLNLKALQSLLMRAKSGVRRRLHTAREPGRFREEKRDDA